MKFSTGQTIYDTVISVDAQNNPISGATFDVEVLKNGSVYTGTSVSMTLIDGTRGLFSASWSGDTTGDYRIFYRNGATGVIYVSDVIFVRPYSEISTNVYVGL